MPQLAEKERAVVGEQLEAAPDHDFLLNEPNGLVSDFARVKTAYLQWLQNMHRAVHIFQLSAEQWTITSGSKVLWIEKEDTSSVCLTNNNKCLHCCAEFSIR